MSLLGAPKAHARTARPPCPPRRAVRAFIQEFAVIARTIPTSIRLTKEEKRRLERVADREGVGVTTIIQDIIREWTADREKEIADKKFAKEMRERASDQG